MLECANAAALGPTCLLHSRIRAPCLLVHTRGGIGCTQTLCIDVTTQQNKSRAAGMRVVRGSAAHPHVETVKVPEDMGAKVTLQPVPTHALTGKSAPAARPQSHQAANILGMDNHGHSLKSRCAPPRSHKLCAHVPIAVEIACRGRRHLLCASQSLEASIGGLDCSSTPHREKRLELLL